jgi:hypothetical protein
MPERSEIISETVAKILALLDQTSKAHAEGSAYELLLWKSAAEAEYLAFQISNAYGLQDFDQASGKTEDNVPDPAGRARRLLEDVKRFESAPREAYAAVRQAIWVLRKAQANFYRSSANDVPTNDSS